MNDNSDGLYWGDFHTHFTPDFERNREQLRSGKKNIDFCAVLFYPFEWHRKKGLWMETTQNLPNFDEIWKGLKELAGEYNHPGKFVTFMGYEWHGNRTRYGDHNVIYLENNSLLDDSWELSKLYDNLRAHNAIALPHHTAYMPGCRGKDWDYMDEHISPVMEIYSVHGSSEGCDTPVRMKGNSNMGPRTGGGSFQDALRRGIEIGVIGSNDGDGLPGSWGLGRAGVWAKNLDRNSIWAAIQKRRTYAVTGDRIVLDFTANGHPMGASFSTSEDEITVSGHLTASCDIEKIELVGRQGVIAAAVPGNSSPSASDRFKLKFEMGWGPNEKYGFKKLRPLEWKGYFAIENGKIEGIEKCFNSLGQNVEKKGGNDIEFSIKTLPERGQQSLTQGFILEFKGSAETRLKGEIEGTEINIPVRNLFESGTLIPMLKESQNRIYKTFDLTPEEVINPDVYFHNARKIKLHRASSEKRYKTDFSFDNVKIEPGKNWFYVRINQINGQKAWSSPVWVDA